MLSPLEIALYALSLAIVLPIAIWSLLNKSKIPEISWAAQYYEAEAYLGLVGNIYLLFVCASGLLRLSAHFGLIDGSHRDALSILLGVPFMTLLVLVLALWARALSRIRHDAAHNVDPDVE
ncbi:hypothetical protein [Hyphomicrobium sp.]|jgi:hypothetical protein|uniref:hypothetical protein n=1 Tax=Hyphomicrobium sp. TaxID=82 RepID=UPI002C4CED8A|nr:hypothetical protein [Hyphomicrobium sp.]HVZ04485.1 hypothetical protein [Hyphomicrobium sp.]